MTPSAKQYGGKLYFTATVSSGTSRRHSLDHCRRSPRSTSSFESEKSIAAICTSRCPKTNGYRFSRSNVQRWGIVHSLAPTINEYLFSQSQSSTQHYYTVKVPKNNWYTLFQAKIQRWGIVQSRPQNQRESSLSP